MFLVCIKGLNYVGYNLLSILLLEETALTILTKLVFIKLIM